MMIPAQEVNCVVLAEENTCGSYIPHTVCDEVKTSGNGRRDNVCAVPPPGNIQNATVDPGLLIRSSEEIDTGQDPVTDPPLIDPPDTATKRVEENPGQDELNPGDRYPSWCEHNSHCLNNSTCVELSEQLSKCICMDGWEGEFCQRVVTAASDCSILSSKWPWLVTVIVLLAIIIASEVHKRRGKSACEGYTIATGENVEMCSIGCVEGQGDRNQ